MGFDVHGMNPKQNTKKPPLVKKIDEGDWLEAFENLSKEERDEYFNLKSKWESENAGSYFRNNVWWWRPMWDYVCEKYKDVLTATDNTMGHENSGHVICKEKAKRIAAKLNKEIRDGSIEKMCMKYETDRRVLKETNLDKNASFAFNYPMSVNNFQEFANFCKHSGGFEIW